MKDHDKKRPQGAASDASRSKPQLRLPKALFSTGFDDITTRWYKSSARLPAELELLRKEETALEMLRASEALIIAPKVSFKTYGENVVLCHLIETYGTAGVEQLLEDGAIEFVLWRGDVVRWDEQLLGLYPIAPLTLSDPAHSDPQASVEMGLKGWGRKPWVEVQRLAKLAIERTLVPPKELPGHAVQAVINAYKSGALQSDGFDPAIPLDNLPQGELRERLAFLGSHVHEGMLLLNNSYDLHEASLSWEALVKVSSKLTTDKGVFEAVDDGLKLEGLPNIHTLILNGVISFKDVVQMRQHPATEEFRKWLWTQPDPRNAETVAKAWLSQMTTRPLKDRTWFKAVRLSSFSVLGGVLGVVVAGPPGAVWGAAIGTALNAAQGAVDSFGLERLLTQPSPRRFAELVRVKAAQQQVAAPAGGNRKERRATAAKARGAKG